MLEGIVASKRARLEYKKETISLRTIKEEVRGGGKVVPSFKQALEKKGISIIGEIKKASPSKGVIRESFDPQGLASIYALHVEAISILTEEDYFLGSDDYLREIALHYPRIPLLRKDFIIDEYQIYESRLLGASAFLLIAELLEKDQLQYFRELGEELGMDVLVEAHDAYHLEKAQQAGAHILGINNRDLHTFRVSLDTTISLSKHVDAGSILVSESGIQDKEDMAKLAQTRVDAVLVGEAFMRVDSIGKKVKSLREAFDEYRY